MKKLILLVVTIIASFSLQAAQYKEGTNYEVLDLQKSATPQVMEFFSFYCPHCYQFEPFIEKLQNQLPKNVEYKKAHVSFMGRDMGVPMAKAYATMVLLKVEDKMIPYMFDQIHRKGNAPKDEQALRQMFIDNGIDGEKFDAAYKSFAADSMQRNYDRLFAEAKLQGVPSVVVNNKYLVKTTGIKSFDEYMALVNYLLTL